MGLLDVQKDIEKWNLSQSKVNPQDYYSANAELIDYQMTDEEKTVLGMIRKHFAQGDVTMQRPRVEFNDMSVVNRAQYDEMAWNTYQPNNGEPASQDLVGGWKSNAIRPVVRNKCISIAAHATARLIFPKVFAFNDQSEVQDDAAHVMEDLMEWAADKSNYTYQALSRVIAAEIYPASIGYTEYAEVYRPVKREKVNGKWKEEMILDETLSGFQDQTVPVDQLYIENFYEPDIQKQGWLLWRRVRSYALLESIYKSKYPNFKNVKPGVQLIYNDANQSFYQVYDTMMRPEMCEELIYWNRGLDLKIILVNGVMLTDADNPNPRNDKLYPFDKFGYELINNRCFYYKSLAFKLQQDANVVNSLYPMIIDGTYLNLMPPMVAAGTTTIGSEVVVPGLVTTLEDPQATLTPVNTANNLKAGFDTLFKVEESLSETSQDPQQQGLNQGGTQTAYEISRLEQNANTVLGLFIKMIADHVRQYGKLRMGDILQYLTIADVSKIEGNSDLLYKTFLLPNKKSGGKTRHRSIQFDGAMKDIIGADEQLKQSFELLQQEEDSNNTMELFKVNPKAFRDLFFQVTISPDVINPRSEDLERAFKLELYDRAINNPGLDQEQVTKDFLLGAYSDIKNPDKYILKQEAMPMQGMGMPQPMPNQSPMASAMGKTPLPQTFGSKM